MEELNDVEARKLSIAAASKEIRDIEKEINKECHKSKGHLILKSISEGAIFHFKDKGFNIDVIKIELQGREIMVKALIKW